MHTKLMFDPIAVSVGPGHRRELSTLSELHQFMDEFDPSRRGKAYGATARAVEAALTGEGSIEQASAAFLTFAKAAAQRRGHLQASAQELQSQLEGAQDELLGATDELRKYELMAERDQERERASQPPADGQAADEPAPRRGRPLAGERRSV